MISVNGLGCMERSLRNAYMLLRRLVQGKTGRNSTKTSREASEGGKVENEELVLIKFIAHLTCLCF